MKTEEIVSFIRTFKNSYQARLDEKTLKIYSSSISYFLRYQDSPISTIMPKDIRNWMVHLETKGYQPATIARELFAIKLLFQFCVEEKICVKNPAHSFKPPKIPDNIPYYLDKFQVQKLRNLTEENIMERSIIELLYSSGVRISELVKIQLEDIDWELRTIHIRSGKRKKGRIVVYTAVCAEYLRSYVDNRKDGLPYLYINSYSTNALHARTIQVWFQGYSQLVDFHVSPHVLRHTFAAHLAEKGMPLIGIQTLLGHVDPRQTETYARLYHHARKEIYDVLM
ncbi:tyrosine-type recombinase/integrase [Mangrovibacillus cuniculi]|uniref:Tyrosine-type recombinase/integrase n=1 Tax=Mangrovibacillus cuniculi TaxID=2593652 RepID=A0A7S8HG96_9BACI|nr:tyrosine-type recombinase/integrase [Mangrovibacillus cuniculi]QPC47557.1 tyrosine-type recombinase/integrase [Mangrovibacillus cuniculi]